MHYGRAMHPREQWDAIDPNRMGRLASRRTRVILTIVVVVAAAFVVTLAIWAFLGS